MIFNENLIWRHTTTAEREFFNVRLSFLVARLLENLVQRGLPHAALPLRLLALHQCPRVHLASLPAHPLERAHVCPFVSKWWPGGRAQRDLCSVFLAVSSISRRATAPVSAYASVFTACNDGASWRWRQRHPKQARHAGVIEFLQSPQAPSKIIFQVRFKEKGSELATDQLRQLSNQLGTFTTKLEEFAQVHTSARRTGFRSVTCCRDIATRFVAIRNFDATSKRCALRLALIHLLVSKRIGKKHARSVFIQRARASGRRNWASATSTMS